MKQELILDELKQLVVEQLDGLVRADDVGIEDPLFSADIGLNSLDGMEVLLKIEERYRVRLPANLLQDDGPTIAAIASQISKLSVDD